jgi:hypothetical protein
MRSQLLPLFLSCLLTPITFAACSNSHTETDSRAINEISLVGHSYKQARAKIIEAGWEPIKATCTERLVCFGEPEVELATNLDEGHTCGRFSRKERALTVCVESIADDERVVSVDL